MLCHVYSYTYGKTSSMSRQLQIRNSQFIPPIFRQTSADQTFPFEVANATRIHPNLKQFWPDEIRATIISLNRGEQENEMRSPDVFVTPWIRQALQTPLQCTRVPSQYFGGVFCDVRIFSENEYGPVFLKSTPKKKDKSLRAPIS